MSLWTLTHMHTKQESVFTNTGLGPKEPQEVRNRGTGHLPHWVGGQQPAQERQVSPSWWGKAGTWKEMSPECWQHSLIAAVDVLAAAGGKLVKEAGSQRDSAWILCCTVQQCFHLFHW